MIKVDNIIQLWRILIPNRVKIPLRRVVIPNRVIPFKSGWEKKKQRIELKIFSGDIHFSGEMDRIHFLKDSGFYALVGLRDPFDNLCCRLSIQYCCLLLSRLNLIRMSRIMSYEIACCKCHIKCTLKFCWIKNSKTPTEIVNTLKIQ